MALKMADVSNVAREWHVSSRWSNRVCHEFFAQGDLERSLGLDIADINDRTKTDVAKIQTGKTRTPSSVLNRTKKTALHVLTP